MGKASREKAERRVRETAGEDAAGRADPALVGSAPEGLALMFTRKGPPSDFPGHAGLGVLLLVALVIVSYYPALTGAFIWDDTIFASMRQTREWSGILDFWFRPGLLELEGHYWPVVYTTFWLEHKLWGFEPVGYHVVNTLLQALNTLLVWRLMLRLSVPGAWLIAAVFAVHPLHVESVAWIIERKDLLSGALYLGSALLWLRFLETAHWKPYSLSMILFVLSLLSKTVTVTLPAALLVLCWWKRGRIGWADLKPLLPFFAVGFAITISAITYQATREPLELDYSLIERAQIAAGALWFYLSKLLWPVDLIVIYPFWEVGAGNWMAWGYVAAALALATALWLARGRIGRGPMAAAAFFVVTLSPVLGFIDYGYMQFSFVADRFQYLAGIGVMAALIGTGTSWASRLPPVGRRGVLGIALIGVGALATLSWQQSRLYRDEIVFFSYIVEHNPKARGGHHNLAEALREEGRADEAFAMARAAMAKKPDFPHAYNNYGLMLQERGEFDEAEKVFQDGLKVEPDDAGLAMRLAELSRTRERYEEALRWLNLVIERQPDASLAYVEKGDVLFHLERYEEAIETLEKALLLDSDLRGEAMLHNFIGAAARNLSRFEKAEKHYRVALRLDPKQPQAHANLVELLVEMERPEEARRHRGEALETYAGDPAGIQRVLNLLRERQRYEEELAWHDEIVRFLPGDAWGHVGRGEVLLHLERPEEAVESLERAVALAPDASTASSARMLLARVARTQGLREREEELYRLILKDEPKHLGALEGFARARIERGRPTEAVEFLERMIALDPDGPTASLARMLLAKTARARGLLGRETEFYLRVLKDDPEHLGALERLARARLEQGRPEEALELYRKFADLVPNQEGAYGNIGLLLYRMGRFEEAREAVDRALALNPDHRQARRVLEQIRTESR